MASDLIKLTSILLFMNIVIYLGMGFAITVDGEAINDASNFRLKGDLMDKILLGSLDEVITSTKDNFTDYDINLSSEFTIFPETQGGEDIGTGGISFVDALRMVIPFFAMLFNIAVSPITLFTTFRLPMILLAIVGIPYMIIFILALMLAIRGVSS